MTAQNTSVPSPLLFGSLLSQQQVFLFMLLFYMIQSGDDPTSYPDVHADYVSLVTYYNLAWPLIQATVL